MNWPQLLALRQRRWLQALSDAIRSALRAELEDTRQELASYIKYTAQLERLLGWREP